MVKGWKTSEFWLAVGASVASFAVALGFANAEEAIRQIFATAAMIVPTMYGLFRTYLKRDDAVIEYTEDAEE